MHYATILALEARQGLELPPKYEWLVKPSRARQRSVGGIPHEHALLMQNTIFRFL